MTKVYVVESGRNEKHHGDWSAQDYTDIHRQIEGVFDSEEKAIDCMIYESTKEIEELRKVNTNLFYRPMDSSIIEEGEYIAYAVTESDPYLPTERKYWMHYESYDLM